MSRCGSFCGAWRWLILIAGLALAFVIDASNLPIPDFLIYGTALTSISWVLLTILANNMLQRAEYEKVVEQHQRFSKRSSESQEWQELTRFVVAFPGMLTPVTHVTLFMYEHLNAQLKLAAEWPANADNDDRRESARSFAACQQCELKRIFNLCQVTHCGARRQDEAHVAGYCLPLKYDNLFAGLLQLECQAGAEIAPEQLQFLTTIAPEITIALALSIAHPRQINLARVEAQLAERRHMVRELHDDLAQEVFFLQLGLDRMVRDSNVALNADERRQLARLRDVTTEVYERIRSNLSVLRAWEHTGFTEAIASLTKLVAANTGVTIDLTTEGEIGALPAPLAQQVFAIVREGLINVEKHSHAQHVQLHPEAGLMMFLVCVCGTMAAVSIRR